MNRETLCILIVTLSLATSIVAQTGSVRSVQDTTRANRYIDQARDHLRNARYDSSIFYFESARSICENLARQFNDSEIWQKYVICLNGITDNLWRKAEYQSALATVDKAIKVSLQKVGAVDPELATSYYYLGSIYRDTGEYEKATTYLNKSLRIYQQCLGESHLKVAYGFNALAILYHFKGDYEQALEYFEKSQAIKLGGLGENHPSVALGYNNIGNALDTKGDFYKAITYYEKSLAIRLATLGENHPEVGDCYSNLGVAYQKLGNYDQAIICLDRSLAIWKRAYGENHPDVALSYYTLAELYETLGDELKALEYHRKALTIRLNTLGENHPDVAQSYYSLGNVNASLQKHDEGMKNYQKSLEILQRAFGENHPHIAQTYQKIAELYLRKNAFAEALAYVQKSIRSLVSDYESVDVYANPALKNISSELDLLFSLELKARLLAGRYSSQFREIRNLQTCLSTCQLASELVDKIRSGYEEGSKLLLGQKASRLYDIAIRASLWAYEATGEAPYREQAFGFAEKSKAAILAQALQESHARQFVHLPASWLAREKELRIDLAFYETEIQKEKQKNDKTDLRKIRDFEDRYFARRREYEKLIAQFEKSYPTYYDLKYRTQTASVATLQKLLDPQTALLEFVLGDTTIYGFAVTKDGLETVAISRDSTFDNLVQTLANSFKNETSKADYLHSATVLYQILVKPFAPRIADKSRWVIIPDGELYQIPFEALLDAKVAPALETDYQALPYLLKQHEISYHYSATLFVQSRKQFVPNHYASLFVGFAPVFSPAVKNGKLLVADLDDLLSPTPARPDKTGLAVIMRDGENLNELKFSEQEVRSILTLFGGRGQVYVHRDASEENFKHNIDGYKYIHVATHGLFDGENPSLSKLAFSQPTDTNPAVDGFIYSGETYNLILNADLLTLSSCESGTGKLMKGEGLMALTRGFLYSGARNIVASLWKVYDQHTSLLMVEMYRQIAAGKSYSAALREAKLKMMANAETAGPQSWASFVLIGK